MADERVITRAFERALDRQVTVSVREGKTNTEDNERRGRELCKYICGFTQIWNAVMTTDQKFER